MNDNGTVETFAENLDDQTRIQILKDYEMFNCTGVVEKDWALRTEAFKLQTQLKASGSPVVWMIYLVHAIHRYYTIKYLKSIGESI